MRARLAPRPDRQHGFTLIELAVTLALVGILMGLAAPAMERLLAQQRLRSASFDLVADLTLARSEALKRATTVRLQPAAGGWRNGWSLAVVPASGATTTVSQRPALGRSVDMVTLPAGLASVEFNAQGMLPDTTTVVKFNLDDGHGGRRCIQLDPTGRPKSQTTACAS